MICSPQIRRLLSLGILSVFASATTGEQTPQQGLKEPQRPELHVLFIGNSFIYFNNMPRLVEAISESVDGPRIKTEMVAIGGARLETLWNEGSALGAIRKQHWDYVVMNEQSALGGGMVNGEKRIGDPANFFKYAEMFDAEIHKSGAKTAILMTWKDKNDPERIQKTLNDAFIEFRNRMHGEPILIPVSTAWAHTVSTAPEIDLYFADNHHPSKEGSYLIACTAYAALTQHSPTGATAKISGATIGDESGLAHAGKNGTLINLSSRVAARIQMIATQSAIPLPLFKPPIIKIAPADHPAPGQNEQPAHLN